MPRWRRELALLTDAHTDVVAARAAAGRTSRAIPIRQSACPGWSSTRNGSPTSARRCWRAGMGAVYTRTSHGEPLRDADPSHVEHLLATYYRPYAAAMTSTVDERLAATGRAVVIDVHSYPSRALPVRAARRPAPAGDLPRHRPVPHAAGPARRRPGRVRGVRRRSPRTRRSPAATCR